MQEAPFKLKREDFGALLALAELVLEELEVSTAGGAVSVEGGAPSGLLELAIPGRGFELAVPGRRPGPGAAAVVGRENFLFDTA